MKKRSLFLSVCFAILATCCQSTIPDPELDFTQVQKDRDSSVSVELWAGASLVQAGSGFIIHSSTEYGTWVITNAHVLTVDLGPVGSDGLHMYAIPKQCLVMTSSGKRLWGEVKGQKIGPDEEGEYVDFCIIKLYTEELFDPIDGIDITDNSLSNQEYVWSWTPYGQPHLSEGRKIIKEIDGKKEELLEVEPNIIAGNSGSAVYDKESGYLSYIVWGKWGETPDEMYGCIISSNKLLDFVSTIKGFPSHLIPLK